MNEEWGPWIEHDGSGRPLPNGAVCQIEVFDPFDEDTASWVVTVGVYSKFGVWYFSGDDADWLYTSEYGLTSHDTWIIRYRIRKPKGLTMLEEIANGIKELEHA